MKKFLGNLLSRSGVGLGSEDNGEHTCNLKGFRPRPLIRAFKEMDYEWEVCLPWYLERLEGSRVLDTGFMEHKGFTRMLADLGFETWGIDIEAKGLEGIHTIKGPVWDIRKIRPEQAFDTIVLNSLLEHLEVGYYTEESFAGACTATIRALELSLSPKGILLLQVPIGERKVTIFHKEKAFYETFTIETLSYLLRAFKIEEANFFARTPTGWCRISPEVACKAKVGGGLPRCLGLVKARRTRE